MSFINTRTRLGEQAAFDALIAHTITEINEDRIYSLPMYSIYYQDSLVSINLPNVTSLTSGSISNCPLLETIDIGAVCNLTSDSPIYKCPKLKALILRGSSGISTLRSSEILDNTQFEYRLAGIFVPRSLLSAYIADSKWSRYAKVIRAIEDMPITDFSTIIHTWTQIKSMVDDESFFNTGYYTINDYKQFTYGEHTVIAEIAKINSEDKYVDFVLKDFDEKTQMRPNGSSSMVEYSNSVVKARLDEIYADELPSDLKTVITPVSKKYRKYDGTTETVTAPLWLLNTKDVNFADNTLKDSEGEEYEIFATNNSRQKHNLQSQVSDTWLLGSTANTSSFMNVSANGAGSSASPGVPCGLVFGFRIQKSA